MIGSAKTGWDDGATLAIDLGQVRVWRRPAEVAAFEEQYAQRSHVTVEQLHALGRFGAFCDCGEPGCSGFQMGSPWEEAIVEDAIQALERAMQ